MESDQVEPQSQTGGVIAQCGFQIFLPLRHDRDANATLDIFLSQREIDSMMSMPASAVRVPFLPEYFRCFRLADRASRRPPTCSSTCTRSPLPYPTRRQQAGARGGGIL